MTNKRLIAIAVSALQDNLCEGCEEPYYDGEKFKSCDEFRDRAAQQLEAILSDEDDGR